jgi:hypothetical protein
VGRVQSAVTALIEDRCREIADFVPLTYFEIAAVLDTAQGPLRLVYRPPADRRLEAKDEAEAIAARIVGATATLAVKTVPKSTKPVDFMSTSLAQKRAFAKAAKGFERDGGKRTANSSTSSTSSTNSIRSTKAPIAGKTASPAQLPMPAVSISGFPGVIRDGDRKQWFAPTAEIAAAAASEFPQPAAAS